MGVKNTITEFATGFLGGNHKSTPYTKAGKATRKKLNTPLKFAGTFLKRNPYVSLGAGLLGVMGVDLGFTDNPGFDKEIRYNLPPYMTSNTDDYEKDYKNYWKGVLGHDGVPKLEDFSDYNNPEAEYNTAIQIYMDTKPL